jgi:hypothetical protein
MLYFNQQNAPNKHNKTYHKIRFVLGTAPSCNYENGGDWHLKFVLDLRSFVVSKLPEDGTLVPKHVVIGT